MKNYYVYILANKTNTVLYTGITNDLIRRLYEHRNGLTVGFTKKYKITKLVYYETYQDSLTAIQREKTIKNFVRRKKEQLVTSMNQTWSDLYPEILSG